MIELGKSSRDTIRIRPNHYILLVHEVSYLEYEDSRVASPKRGDPLRGLKHHYFGISRFVEVFLGVR